LHTNNSSTLVLQFGANPIDSFLIYRVSHRKGIGYLVDCSLAGGVASSRQATTISVKHIAGEATIKYRTSSPSSSSTALSNPAGLSATQLSMHTRFFFKRYYEINSDNRVAAAIGTDQHHLPQAQLNHFRSVNVAVGFDAGLDDGSDVVEGEEGVGYDSLGVGEGLRRSRP